jgi:hypothetical protein
MGLIYIEATQSVSVSDSTDVSKGSMPPTTAQQSKEQTNKTTQQVSASAPVKPTLPVLQTPAPPAPRMR